MARRKSVNIVRNIGGDIRYGSELIQKLINIIMERGKKSIATDIVYDALDYMAKRLGDKDKMLKALAKAIENVTPIIEVRPRRVGGSVYQIPVEVNHRRARSLALRWLKNSAETRGDKNMGLRLGNELLDAAEGRGGAAKKRQDVHKMAESNRAFSHLGW